MAAALDKQRLSRQGLRPIAPDEGLALLEEAWRLDLPLVGAFPWDRQALRHAFDVVPPLWRELLPDRPRPRPAGGDLLTQLEALSAEDRGLAILAVVRENAAQVLGLASPEAVPSERPLKEMGIDSLMAVELRNRLNRRLGLSLPATLAFDHPTIADIAGYVGGKLFTIEKPPTPMGATANRPAEAVAIPTRDDLASLSDLEVVEAIMAECHQKKFRPPDLYESSAPTNPLHC
jgi:acyl carrier protein